MPSTTTSGGLTPEQQELIKQIKALALQHGDSDESPEWQKATGHMQVVLDKVEKASPAQQAADAKNDTGASAGKVTKPESGQAAMPTQTVTLPKVPAGTVVNKDGVTESAEDELARWLRIARG